MVTVIEKNGFTLTKQSWKCNLISPAAKPGLRETALYTAFFTMDSADGQEYL